MTPARAGAAFGLATYAAVMIAGAAGAVFFLLGYLAAVVAVAVLDDDYGP